MSDKIPAGPSKKADNVQVLLLPTAGWGSAKTAEPARTRAAEQICDRLNRASYAHNSAVAGDASESKMKRA